MTLWFVVNLYCTGPLQLKARKRKKKDIKVKGKVCMKIKISRNLLVSRERKINQMAGSRAIFWGTFRRTNRFGFCVKENKNEKIDLGAKNC